MQRINPAMDDMLAAHRGDLAGVLRVARGNLAALMAALQDAIEAPETVSADKFADMVTNVSTELKWVAVNITNGMPPQAPTAA